MTGIVSTPLPPSVQSLLGHLANKGVRIEVEGQGLSLELGRVELCDAQRTLLLENKQCILQFLADYRIAGASATQERVWHLAQAGRPDQYHLSGAFRLRGDLNPLAIGEAATDVVNRHEALRASFVVMGGALTQLIPPTATIACDLLPAASAISAADQLDELVRAYCQTPFDLARGPLFRVAVAQESKDSAVLVFCLHHLVADEWSIDLLVREMSDALAARQSGRRPTTQPPPMDYTAFVAWERQRTAASSLDANLAYWKELLHDYQVPTLNSDLPRPPFLSGGGREVYRRLASDMSSAVRDYCKRKTVTPFTLFVSSVYLVLSRYTGQRDVVIGIPVAGRGMGSVQDVIGLFTSLAAVRVRPPASGPFGRDQLVQAVQDGILGAQEHASTQSGPHIRDSNSGAQSPLTSVLVSHAARPSSLPFGLGVAEPIEIDFRVSKFELAFELAEIGGGDLCVRATLSTDLFSVETAHRLCEQIERALTALVHRRCETLADIDLTSGCERDMILADWSRGRMDEPPDCTIHERISLQAEYTPDHPALILADGALLTYRDVDRRTNQLAMALQNQGVTPDTPVALYVERSFAMPIGAIGILKAGGAYVPINPDDPLLRNRFILDDCGAQIIVAQVKYCDAALELAARGSCRIIAISDEGDLKDPPAGRPQPLVKPHHLAYVIYTSGSTGTPKGVMIDHRAIANRLFWMQAQYPLSCGDRVLQKTPFTFDVSVWELFWPLMTGASMVLADPGDHREPLRLARLIRDRRVTTLHFVPSMLAQLLNVAGIAEHTRGVTRLFCSGEALPRDLMDRCLSTLTCALHNLYGPTEAAIDVSFWQCRADYPVGAPIGRPVANCRLLVLDEARRPLGIGMPGELYIGGICLARGYVGKPELTDAKFRTIPIDDCHRWYRSGDLARWLPDGNLEFLGRIDDQIKLNGHRIEPMEIEAVLRKHPLALDAAVITEASKLIAFVVANPSVAPCATRWGKIDATAGAAEIARHELPNGLEIAHINPGETAFLYEEIHEKRAYLRHGIRLGGRPCVVDVGANIGLFSILVAALNPDAVIYAIEPMPALHEVLEVNAHVYMPDAKLIRQALGRSRSEAVFTYYPLNTLMSTQYPSQRRIGELMEHWRTKGDDAEGMGLTRRHLERLALEASHGETHICSVMTLSQLIAEQQIDRIHLLKVDVEGSELDVLAGIEPQDWARIDQLVMEVDGTDGRVATVTDLLQSQGYQVRLDRPSLAQSQDFQMLYARRPSHGSDDGDFEMAAGAMPSAFQSRQRHATALRAFAAHFLSEAMVPSEVILIDALPRLSNGKVDRNTLRQRRRAGRARQEYLPPAAAAEMLLAKIWESVLKIDRVGIRGDFFELGGDSLKAMQVVVRAQQSGLSIDVRDLYEQRTIAALCERIRRGATDIEVAPVREGEFPLTPIQRWFFDLPHVNVDHWNQAATFHLSPRVPDSRLREAIATLLRRHDVFRVRFTRKDGIWNQNFGKTPNLDVLEVADLSHLRGEPLNAELARRNAALQASLRLGDQKIFRAARYHLGADRDDRLFLVIHHLYVDQQSWIVLVSELDLLLREGDPPLVLPPPAYSFQAWVLHVTELMNSTEIREERGYWNRIARQRRDVEALLAPESIASGESDRVVTIASAAANNLTRQLALSSRATAAAVWITALCLAYFKWTGNARFGLFVETHGRSPLAIDKRLSGVVGWFTSLYPMVIANNAAGPLGMLQVIRSSLAAIPNGGRGYQICQYGGTTERRWPDPDLIFNYSGEMPDDLGPGAVLRRANDPCGLARSPDFAAPFVSVDGVERAGTVSFSFSAGRSLAAGRHLEDFARSFEEAVAELARPDVAAPLPKEWAIAAHPDILETDPIPVIGVQDSYDLSPMQKSFFLLDEAGRSSSYNARAVIRCTGPLDVESLERALRSVVARHESLRTRFEFSMGEPRAFLEMASEPDFTFRDLSQPGSASAENIHSLISEILETPFVLSRGSLLRLRVIRLQAQEHIVCLCVPHIVIDRWSMRLIEAELMAAYAANGSAASLPPLRIQYKDFVNWYGQLLAGEKMRRHADYWYEKLRSPFPILQLPTDYERSSIKCNAGGRVVTTLQPDVARGLRDIASSAGASLFMCILALLKALIARYSGQEDIVIGVPVAGRFNEELETQVGLYMNVVALRDAVRPDDTFAVLLARVKQTALEAFQHQVYPFDNLIQELDVPVDLSRNPLFDVLVNFHNEDSLNRRRDGDTRVGELHFAEYDWPGVTSRFDLSFDFVEEGPGIQTHIEYASTLFEYVRMVQLIDDFQAICRDVVRDATVPLATLLGSVRGHLPSAATADCTH
jgi:amino acid adenylation domain-containing protein/FkbM family methyltransferase